jgi:hypothetical protein
VEECQDVRRVLGLHLQWLVDNADYWIGGGGGTVKETKSGLVLQLAPPSLAMISDSVTKTADQLLDAQGAKPRSPFDLGGAISEGLAAVGMEEAAAPVADVPAEDGEV